MNPIVYKLITENKDVPKTFSYKVDSSPPPKLITYGFNDSVDKLDFIGLTSNKYYRSGLNFDLDTMKKKLNKSSVKNINQTQAEFIEIVKLFGLDKSPQKIYTNRSKDLVDIQEIFDNKFEQKNKSASLIYWKLTDIDIIDVDESTYIELLLKDINDIFSALNKSGTLVLQICGTKTNIMAEFIEYFAKLFDIGYIVRPIIVSNLSDTKYLLLDGYNNSYSNIKFKSSNYLVSIGIDISLNIRNVIQCINSHIMPIIFNSYRRIKDYLDSQVYEGATYTDFITEQNNNADRWISMYIKKDININELLQNILIASTSECIYHKQYEQINY